MEESLKKPLNMYLIFAVFIVLILLGIGYFTLLASSPIPTGFFSKYREQNTLSGQTLATTRFDYGPLSQQIQAKNASEAANISKQNLVQSLKNQQNMLVINKKTADLKTVLSSISDSTLREKTVKLFSLLDQRNKRLQSVIDTQVTIFTMLRNHFGALAVGEKGPDMPQNIDTVISASQTEIISVIQLQTTIDVSFDEIVKLSGVDTSISQTTDSIRMSLSVTPQKQPLITDFPTPTPAPTIEPTATTAPDATPSAEETATPSAL